MRSDQTVLPDPANSTTSERPSTEWAILNGTGTIQITPDALKVIRQQYEQTTATFEVGLLLGVYREAQPSLVTIEQCIPLARGYSPNGLDKHIEACLSEFLPLWQSAHDAALVVLGYYCLQSNRALPFDPRLSSQLRQQFPHRSPLAINIVPAEPLGVAVRVFLEETLVREEHFPWAFSQRDLPAPAPVMPVQRQRVVPQSSRLVSHRHRFAAGATMALLIVAIPGWWLGRSQAAATYPHQPDSVHVAAQPGYRTQPLRVERDSPSLLVLWDPASFAGPINVAVQDGSTRKQFALTVAETQKGSFQYHPLTNHVVFSLETRKAGRDQRELIQNPK